MSGEGDDDVMISETWPRRKRSAIDEAMLTIDGCSAWLERSSGSLNGFHNRSEPLARDAADESFSQKRDREAARTLRLQWGAESWQAVTTAYAEERLKELEIENMTTKKEAT